MPTNEPLFDGVPLGKLVDKPVYAKRATIGYSNADMTTVKYTFKTGDFIGNLESWWLNAQGQPTLIFYRSKYDYDNFNPFYVPLTASNVTSPSVKDIKADIKKEKDEAANAGKTMLQIYIEKYAPWIVGGVVVAVALPSITSSLRGGKMGATKKNSSLFLAGGAALLLLAFRKPKSKNKIELGEVIDITDWKNTESKIEPLQPRPRQLTVERPVLYSSYDSIMNGVIKQVKKTPYTI